MPYFVVKNTNKFKLGINNQNDLLNYKSKLKSEKENFCDYLGSCERYLQNKRLKDIKYYE